MRKEIKNGIEKNGVVKKREFIKKTRDLMRKDDKDIETVKVQ